MCTGNYRNILFLGLCGLFFEVSVFAASLPFSIEGDYLIRLPNRSQYVKNRLDSIPDNVIVSIPDLKNASATTAIIDGHLIKLYPGTTFKISKGYFIPLTGRFEFSSDAKTENYLNILANNCNAGYLYGQFLIEATPDNGVFFALKDKGNAWIKDSSRNVFDLKLGQQVHIPMFGKGVLKNRLESFWGKNPSSFNHLGEVGQETAYGIVGTDFTAKIKKDKIDEPTKNSVIENVDDDVLDAEEEAWLAE